MGFSVIIPVYNTGALLEQAVDSVLRQGYAPVEILLVDDGSTDGSTPELCDRLALAHPGTVVAHHKSNGGAGDARNFGIARAGEEYLLFLDSDDTLLPGALEILDRALKETSCDVCYFGHRITGGKAEAEFSFGPPYTDAPFVLAQQPGFLNETPTACMAVWKKELLEKNRIWFRDRGWGEDLCMTRKLLAVAGSIRVLPDVLYNYFQQEQSVSHRTRLETNLEIIGAVEEVLDWYREKDLFRQYEPQLCRLTLDNVLYAVAMRVMPVDARHPVLEQVRQFTLQQFPHCARSAYVSGLPRNHRIIYRLLIRGHFPLAQAIFSVKRRLLGSPADATKV